MIGLKIKNKVIEILKQPWKYRKVILDPENWLSNLDYLKEIKSSHLREIFEGFSDVEIVQVIERVSKEIEIIKRRLKLLRVQSK